MLVVRTTQSDWQIVVILFVGVKCLNPSELVLHVVETSTIMSSLSYFADRASALKMKGCQRVN